MLFALFSIFLSFVFVLILLRLKQPEKRVCIIVLGDVGRSPRMQYHAVSFAKHGYNVDVVGFGGSKPHEEFVRRNLITHHIIKEVKVPGFLPRLLGYVFKTIFQASQLFFVTTLTLKKPSHILIQNPPAIPTMAVAWFVSSLINSRLIIDWHNYGYTILGLTLGPTHPLVKFSNWYEKFFGRLSAAGLCVTKAMKDDLAQRWSITAQTLYDRPPDMFKETPIEEQHQLFLRLGEEYHVFAGGEGRSAFTEVRGGQVAHRKERPALVISSTSWTEDEDFSILLSALEEYEKACSSPSSKLPPLVCAITGKGPQKEYYKQVIAQKEFEHVQICTPWLTAEDYPKLLGSADLGVCLHTSSSGLDLPMKVVDMFGCGLPVCAINFKCLHELVKHKENGLIFHNGEQLAEQFQDLLNGFPNHQQQLQTFRNHLKSFQALRWEESWNQVVFPILNQ